MPKPVLEYRSAAKPLHYKRGRRFSVFSCFLIVLGTAILLFLLMEALFVLLFFLSNKR